MTTMISLDDITVDPRCQARVAIDTDAVAEYAEAMLAGATFPPITVFHDGETYWLADGFHRAPGNRAVPPRHGCPRQLDRGPL